MVIKYKWYKWYSVRMPVELLIDIYVLYWRRPAWNPLLSINKLKTSVLVGTFSTRCLNFWCGKVFEGGQVTFLIQFENVILVRLNKIWSHNLIWLTSTLVSCMLKHGLKNEQCFNASFCGSTWEIDFGVVSFNNPEKISVAWRCHSSRSAADAIYWIKRAIPESA